MGFEKGNTYGKYTKRGKGKKTIIKDAITSLEMAGIKPFEVTQELLTNLTKKDKQTIQEQELIFKIVSTLYKYESLTKAEEHKLIELTKEVQELKEDTKNILSTNEILQQLKNDTRD